MESTFLSKFDAVSAFKHIHDIVEILSKYSWIYSVKNTDIFVNDVLETIPKEWVEILLPLPWCELNQLPFGLIKENWPNSLKTFIKQCNYLAELRFSISNSHDNYQKDNQTLCNINKNIPLKKQTEIEAMSELVHKVCKTVKCHTVLDVGSGLGYLDRILHHNFGLHCIGLDAISKYTNTARARLKEDPCYSSMQYETMLVESTIDCVKKLQVVLQKSQSLKCECQKLPSPVESASDSKESYVMIGLHCCGKLAQDMMKIFCRMEELKAFICVGCCYNKVNLVDFPMSEAAKTAIKVSHVTYPSWHPCISGLRLGSHATRSEWAALSEEMISLREKNLIYRAILQQYLIRENIDWCKPKRRMRKNNFEGFEIYCANMFKEVQDLSEKEKEQRLNDLASLYSEKEYLFPHVRILLVLQILLQPIWESFVILDRMLYFNENSIFTEVFAMWNDAISPRNVALCGYKR